jgi:beta-glucosidase
LLPLKKDVASIAVIGPLADSRRDLEGGWIVKSDPARVVTVLDGIKRKLAPNARVLYAQGSEAHSGSTAGFAAALEAARQAEVVVLAIGETWDMSGEAKSRSDIGIPGQQVKLFEALKATGKPIVVLLFAGRPLVFDSVAEQADAIVYAWLPGEGGNAIANVLFGDYNPSGKLPMTLPRSVGQIPLTYRQYPTGRPVVDAGQVVYKSAYIDSPNTPRYAFGFGLSYTDFAYSDLTLSKASMRPSGTLTLSMVLTNTGKVAGEEVVQLYLRDLVASVARPLKELKGFQKIRLEAGERKTVAFKIDKEMLSFFNRQLQWVAEPGRFELMVGGASDDIRLRQQIELLAR